VCGRECAAARAAGGCHQLQCCRPRPGRTQRAIGQ
jgi:hypothetical protein